MKNQSLFYVILFLWSCSASAQKEYIYSDSKGAIKGYDPVAYFTAAKPVKGKREITYTWKNAQWYFVSTQNRDAFKADPEAYAPQFGGYCAYAVSENTLYKIDPKSWKIVDGKLYLNYDRETQEAWEANLEERIKKAEAYWPAVLYIDDN
ncbi:MAG: YHS domain-containing (seleno)protein [Cytophagales bacterium]|nr:YHS domain-containing (seleno)protein [Cytophagales bacterium]